MRLIDADVMIKDLQAMQRQFDAIAIDGMIRGIEKQPTIEAEPVRHGKWVYGDDVDIQCSECGKDAMSDWMKYTQVYSPYCPWCGAKMDLK